ncbi:MAG: cobyrinate a,c-diamide synthase [Desulfovibrio sp.]|uniref:cobyrinate a,c-diamide synthase n=1 Tax=Desulfovibrio sp. TaxID=885 RepID=UPI00135E351E|nr:cobyrinate a,c-diamide synthase [Desulfovibrio sp.]MTJ92042.1 cobyrinate a,c-diamide synthase [Desulfovibrio sp.]
MPKPQPSMPGLVIGGTGSNSGKTTLTLALLCALHERGLVARAAKTGPDYIDAAFHANLTGQPAANLDTWMCRESAPSPAERPLGGGRSSSTGLPAGLKRIFARMATPIQPQTVPFALGTPDVLVVEGAMGLFDGGHKGVGSTAHLAALLGLPILLVLNAGGMGQSVAALAEGFLHHRPAWARVRPMRFLGMVCTHVGSTRHAELLRQSLAPLNKSSGVPLLGLMPRQGAPTLPARHLGLVEAREVLPGVDRKALAQWAEDNCDIDLLLRRAGAAALRRIPPVKVVTPVSLPQKQPEMPPANSPAARFFPASTGTRRGKRCLRIGMAWDEAFSFCYADLPAVLGELKAEVVPFSPLRDTSPPAGCAGLYFPGGYPELHADRIADNAAMRATLHSLAAQSMPIYGECGGYMYLMRSLLLNGQQYAMSGLLPRSCILGQTKAALGYRAALALADWPTASNRTSSPPENSAPARPLWVRGHEFHYAQEQPDPLPAQCSLLWQLHDSQGRLLRADGCRTGSVAGSWLHCYPEGSRRFWRAWLGLCSAYLSAQGT